MQVKTQTTRQQFAEDGFLVARGALPDSLPRYRELSARERAGYDASAGGAGPQRETTPVGAQPAPGDPRRFSVMEGPRTRLQHEPACRRAR